MLMRFFRQRRRARLQRLPVPSSWEKILKKNVLDWRYLQPQERQRLSKHIQVFLAEKEFVGCGGLEITEEIRVTIAGWACLLILNKDPEDYFPQMTQILVYPDSFVVPHHRLIASGDVVEEEEDVNEGESWHYGAVIVAWASVLESRDEPETGCNVVLHEFAHQLDYQGTGDGAPVLKDRELRRLWPEVMKNSFEFLQQAEREGRETVIDPYGNEGPEEFFAVAVEAFFDLPEELREEMPELYRLLSRYFAQDPATRRCRSAQ